MDQAYEALKIEKIRRFLSDKQKFERLVATVNRLLKCWSYGSAERATTAEHIISEPTKDAICNDRKGDTDKMPDFAGWVITQLRSKLCDLMRKQRSPVSLEEEMEKSGFDPAGNCGLSGILSPCSRTSEIRLFHLAFRSLTSKRRSMIPSAGFFSRNTSSPKSLS